MCVKSLFRATVSRTQRPKNQTVSAQTQVLSWVAITAIFGAANRPLGAFFRQGEGCDMVHSSMQHGLSHLGEHDANPCPINSAQYLGGYFVIKTSRQPDFEGVFVGGSQHVNAPG